MFRADREDEENFEKKIVSRRWGVWEARYAAVKIKVGKYGKVGRGEGAEAAARDGFATEPNDGADSSGTI